MNGKNIAIGIVVLAVISIAVFALGTKPATPSAKPETQPTVTGQPDTQTLTGVPTLPIPTTANKSTYKNGTYEAVGDYVSPGGPQQVDITLIITDGIVSSANFVPKAKGEMSVKM